MNENLSGEQISHLVKELFQQHLRTGLENFTRSERVRNKALKNECVRIFKDLRRNHIPLEIALATYSCLGHQALVVGLLAKAAERQKKINTSTVHELIRQLAAILKKLKKSFNVLMPGVKIQTLINHSLIKLKRMT